MLVQIRRLIYPMSIVVLGITTIGTVGGQLASTGLRGQTAQRASQVKVLPPPAGALAPEPGHPGRYVLQHPQGATKQTPATPQHFVLKR